MNAHANKRGLHLFVSGYTSTSKTTCGVPRLVFMAKSLKDKDIFSLENTLQTAKSLVLNNPKVVQFDNSIIIKLKNIVTDFPDHGLSSTKLLNAIVLKWLEEHRDELMKNHILNSAKRY